MQTKPRKTGRLTTKQHSEAKERFKVFRSMGFSLTEIAQKLNISLRTIQRYENEILEREISQIKRLQKIIQILEKRAFNPKTPVKDLVIITKEIERLECKIISIREKR